VSRSQLKLMGALGALVLLVVLVSGALAERSLRRREGDLLRRSLEQRAQLAAELVADIPFETTPSAQLDALADRLGRAADARVTLVARDGSVVGDSHVPLARLASLANHAERPEVREALAGHSGRAERISGTLGRALLYVAVPQPGGGGVVRLAVDATAGQAAAGALISPLLLAGAVGLLAAAALSYGIAWLALRPLHELRRLTASVAAGEREYRLPRRFRGELGEIAGSIKRLAGQLRARLLETTGDKERLQAVLEGMAEGVLVVDGEAEIVLANDRVREFFGVSGPMQGRTVLAAIRNAELAEVLVAAQREGEALARGISVSHPAHRTLRVHAVRFPRDAAEATGIVAVFHDVTELAELETMRREFVANASHELRTPLAAIRGFAETLLGTAELSERDRRSYLEVIDRHARRLGNIVSDLLELSTIESGKAGLELGPVDVALLVASLIRDSASRFEEKRLEVTHELKGSATAWADGRAVEQILLNLLDNAVKYSNEGGRIHVSVEGNSRRVTVRVADTGIGIPQSDLARIFERFYRVDKARSRALGGTGLGLAIVKHLVQTLGGEIRVQSELGKGSTFTFTLRAA
jgi:two-component system phosphate regulon sensor histidine kinase PhoR